MEFHRTTPDKSYSIKDIIDCKNEFNDNVCEFWCRSKVQDTKIEQTN